MNKQKQAKQSTEVREAGRSTPATILRAEVIQRIESRLAGTIDDAALAGWAFDLFYAEELGEAEYEAGSEETLADVLDSLMFGDDPGFRLDEDELRALIVQLT